MKKLRALITTLLTIFIISAPIMSANAAVVGLNGAGEDTPLSQNDSLTPSIEDAPVTLPTSYSSLALGYCPTVKRQIGNVCWAFASISSFETSLIKDNLFTKDLSTSHMDNWGTTDENGFGWQRMTSQAGFTYIPLGYFSSWNGPVTEDGEEQRYGITSMTYLGKEDHEAIKQCIMKNGAVTANFNTYNRAYSKDNNSYALTDDIGDISGHTVSVVGWDDNYDRMNFDGNYLPKENGAWLCKNSWGPNNNTIGGYLWISYEDFYLFNNDIFGPSFSIDEYEPILPGHYMYQNEKYGATYEFNYFTDDDDYYANVFDFSKSGNVVDKIIFESTSLGAEYKVYYAPLNSSGAPATMRKQWILLDEGTVNRSGYISCDIGGEIFSEKKAAVIVRINTSGVNADKDEKTRVLNGIGVSEWLKNRETQSMIFEDPCRAGESYVYFNGQFVDLKDFYKEYLDDETGGTLVIKALTTRKTGSGTKGDADNNGIIDINDVTLIQRYAVKSVKTLSSVQEKNADFNGDGEINVSDATAVQKMIVGS